MIQLVGGLGPWESARVDDWSRLRYGSPKILDAVDRIGERIYGPAWGVFIAGRPIVSRA